MKFNPSSIMGILLKIISLISVFAIIMLALGMEYYAFKETWNVMSYIINGYTEEDKIVEKTLHCLDMILLGTTFMVIACGVFELFVSKIKNLPQWLQIEDLDDLKGMIIKMVIVVMAISFTGRVVIWNGKPEIMFLGFGFSCAVVAMGFFLWIKSKKST